MASKPPHVGSVGAVFGKGAAATGQDIQLDAQCVFYIDPEFTEIKDSGMPPASVSASKSLLNNKNGSGTSSPRSKTPVVVPGNSSQVPTPILGPQSPGAQLLTGAANGESPNGAIGGGVVGSLDEVNFSDQEDTAAVE